MPSTAPLLPADKDHQPEAGGPWGAVEDSISGSKQGDDWVLSWLESRRLKCQRLVAGATLRSCCWWRGVGGCQQAHGDIKAACAFPPQAAVVRLVSGDGRGW